MPAKTTVLWAELALHVCGPIGAYWIITSATYFVPQQTNFCHQKNHIFNKKELYHNNLLNPKSTLLDQKPFNFGSPHTPDNVRCQVHLFLQQLDLSCVVLSQRLRFRNATPKCSAYVSGITTWFPPSGLPILDPFLGADLNELWNTQPHTHRDETWGLRVNDLFGSFLFFRFWVRMCPISNVYTQFTAPIQCMQKQTRSPILVRFSSSFLLE